jgi:hypothetical protein
MGTASERAKHRRSFRLEFLEDRNLLSNVFSPRSLAGEPAFTPRPVTTIVGHVQGLPATAGLYIATLPGHHSYSGHGVTRPLGDALFSAQEVETTSGTSLTITNGSGQMYDYRGNEIFVAYTGTGTVAPRKVTRVTLDGSVLNGTGRFLGERGSFHATGNLNPFTGRLYLNYTIVLNHPA